MTQLRLNLPIAVPKEAYDYGLRSSGEAHGVVLTKPHIVELILDLVGYTANRDLRLMPLLEPSCGRGAFLLPAIARLLESARGRRQTPSDLSDCIAAYDIDPAHVAETRSQVRALLSKAGWGATQAASLAQSWVRQGDFLLSSETARYGAVVGNPPYVRIEQIAPILQAEYRERFSSIYDRADLYVAFIERGLSLLRPGGTLSFICADRWTLNKYGAPLRRLIASKYHVHSYIDLQSSSPFESEVVAYPAIFSISRTPVRQIAVAKLRTGSAGECTSLSAAMRSASYQDPDLDLSFYDKWFEGDAPWTLTSPNHLRVLRHLESRFLPIESDGKSRIGIGVATGNDSVFIVEQPINIEPDRLIPLVMRDNIVKGKIEGARKFVLNAFSDKGGVVDLAEYPRLAAYLRVHAPAIRARHVAKTNPHAWFRTIDRVYPDLVAKPKLLIPDIAGSNEVVLDSGLYHPHHNLYYVTSEAWDMEVLGALLSSRVALFFIWSYAVKMRGGYLRFQAQYLRRIRVPEPGSIPKKLAKSLAGAFRKRDFTRIDALALQAYGIDQLPAFDFVDTRR